MRSSTLSRPPTLLEHDSVMSTPPVTQLPTIRVTTATPSAMDTHRSSPSTTNILAPKIELAPRKRLVPKKSKLSLLGGSKKEKSKDFSDISRRIGARSPTVGRSFEIYVDPADDPDIGEIVVLKKKKSRVGLNEVQWGPLGDVTNTGKEQAADNRPDLKKSAPIDTSVKAKDDEKDKWWSKRGRKDSKGKPKDPSRAKSKEILTETAKENRKSSARDSSKQLAKARKSTHNSKGSDRRQRSQSLDAGTLFGTTTDQPKANFISVPMPDDDEKVTTTSTRRGHARTNTSPSLFGERPSTLEGIAAITQPPKEEEKPKNGSIALRAIRSVRSLARIGSWAQLRNTSAEDNEQPAKKMKDKTEKKERKKKERTMSLRGSKGGFEALKNTFGSVRKSVDLSGTIRSVSSQATAVSNSSDATIRHGRRVSRASIASTIRCDSSRGTGAECVIGRAPKSSGASSIRWDDHMVRRTSGMDSGSTAKRNGSKKRSPEGRKRPGLASLFPDLLQSNAGKETLNAQEHTTQPGCAEESETSATLLDISCVTSLDSPSRRARPRPLSEQMLGRERPRGVIGDKDTGVIKILDSATSDLACLINRLDLEATPTASPVGESPRSTCLDRSRVEAPNPEVVVKKPSKQLSIENLLGSLRAYTHRRKAASTSAAETLGRRIAPWPESDTELKQPEQKDRQHVLRREMRQVHPSDPAPERYEPGPVVHPLPPPSRRVSDASLDKPQNEPRMLEYDPALPSSFATFGKKRSSGSKGSVGSTGTARQARKGRGSSASQSGPVLTSVNDVFGDGQSRPAQGKRSTLGSMGSTSASFDPDDPDCDIPGELRMLLNKTGQRDTSYSATSYEEAPSKHLSAKSSLPSPGSPPHEPLPPVRSSVPSFSFLTPDEDSDFNDDAFIASSDDENDTKKSFDFTAELTKLDCGNNSPTADNKSFIMQLDEAFKTPKKYSVRDLGSKLGLGVSNNVPPVPELRHPLAHEVALPESPEASEMTSDGNYRDSSYSEYSSLDRADEEDMCVRQPLQVAQLSLYSRPSHGRLDMNFRFGGNTSEPSVNRDTPQSSFVRPECVPRMLEDSCDQAPSSRNSAEFNELDSAKIDFLVPFATNQSRSSLGSAHSGRPMTLSDIIPPPDHETRYSYSSLSEDESALLRSILERAANLSDVSLGMNSDHDSTNEDRQHAMDRLIAHSRQNSDVSFSGLAAYDEIRRGFEFGSSRSAFYPPQPPAAGSSLMVPNTAWRNSIMSLGSVSSYGHVTRDGAKNPFDYAVPSKRISEDMSYTVEDTFSFLKRDPMRQRVDSGESKYSVDSQHSHMRPESHVRPDVHQRRSRRQVESIISVTSGPPVSLYNRGYNAGRTTITWRQRTSSFESVASGHSAHRLGRPGVGEKMFESGRELGVPLASISASPSQVDSSRNWHSSYDSLVDNEHDRDQDSIMNDTGRHVMMGSQESLFGAGGYRHGLIVPPRFRPVSVYSFETRGSPKKDDDTVISMLGGGFVRRRSIRSILERSPCARIEKRHQGHYARKILTRFPSKDDYGYSVDGSPDKARLISRPSFTSAHEPNPQLDTGDQGSSSRVSLFESQSLLSATTSEAVGYDINEQLVDENADASRMSAHFGDDRMSQAQHGLLERKSLEDCCLSAEGEDNANTRQSLPVFRKPEPAARKRSTSTGQITATSITDTPPLTRSRSSRSSSQFGSQGSIDIDRLNVLLANSTNVPGSGRPRLHRRGSGHRRKISEARASRTSSVYETIEEAPELYDALFYIHSASKLSLDSMATHNLSVTDVNAAQWESEDVGPALRMMRALQLEARMTVDASRRQWVDTPYSIDALQSFQPPPDPVVWKAMLEQSQKNFGHLPPDFRGCARRPRTISRPSPYPRVRVFTRPPAAKPAPSSNVAVPNIKVAEQTPKPLQDVPTSTNFDANIERRKPVFTATTLKPKSTEAAKDTLEQRGSVSRGSVLFGARKLMSGSTKTNIRNSPRKGKENTGQGATLKVETLRISRPRPLNKRPSANPRTIRV